MGLLGIGGNMKKLLNKINYWLKFKKKKPVITHKDYSGYVLVSDPSWRKERDEFLEKVRAHFEAYIKEYGQVPKTLYLDPWTYEKLYLRFAEEFKVDDIFPRDYFLWRLNVKVIEHPFISVGV